MKISTTETTEEFIYIFVGFYHFQAGNLSLTVYEPKVLLGGLWKSFMRSRSYYFVLAFLNAWRLGTFSFYLVRWLLNCLRLLGMSRNLFQWISDAFFRKLCIQAVKEVFKLYNLSNYRLVNSATKKRQKKNTQLSLISIWMNCKFF